MIKLRILQGTVLIATGLLVLASTTSAQPKSGFMQAAFTPPTSKLNPPPIPFEERESELASTTTASSNFPSSSVPAISDLPGSATTGAGTQTTETTTTTTGAGESGITIPEVAPTLPEITTPTLPVDTPEVPENPVDSEFLNETNQEREAVAQELVWSNELAAYARVHLIQMMLAGRLFHSNIGRLLTHWTVVGENVGVGPTVDSIQDAYMSSPTHAENVVLPHYTHFGSASEYGLDGYLWTVEVFGAR